MATTSTTNLNQTKSPSYEGATKRVADLTDNLSEAANTAGRKVRNFIDSAQSEISDSAEKVTQQIRNKPLQSSAIALGVGFVLGVILSR